MGLRKEKNPFFSYITFQVDQFPPLHGQADFTIGWMQWIVQGRDEQARQKSITGCEHKAWGSHCCFSPSGCWSVTSVPGNVPPHIITDFFPLRLFCCTTSSAHKEAEIALSGLSCSDCWLPSKGTALSFFFTHCWFSWLTQAKKKVHILHFLLKSWIQKL